jgi:hypothetical protein
MLRIAEKIDIPVIAPILVERGGEEDYRRFFPATSKNRDCQARFKSNARSGLYNASTRGPHAV